MLLCSPLSSNISKGSSFSLIPCKVSSLLLLTWDINKPSLPFNLCSGVRSVSRFSMIPIKGPKSSCNSGLDIRMLACICRMCFNHKEPIWLLQNKLKIIYQKSNFLVYRKNFAVRKGIGSRRYYCLKPAK